jgi:hypothetical protein
MTKVVLYRALQSLLSGGCPISLNVFFLTKIGDIGTFGDMGTKII